MGSRGSGLIRVERLAAQLGLTTRRLLELLRDNGMASYAAPGAAVPVALIDRVWDIARGGASSGGAPSTDYARLMSAAGVRPLRGGEGRARPRPRPRAVELRPTEVERLREIQSRLRQELDEALSSARMLAAGAVPVAAVLERRGLCGETEQGLALRALLDSRQLLPHLSTTGPAALARLLDRSVILHCGREGCPRPAGLAAVPVSAERCEVCGGGDVVREARRFSDALLLRGLRRAILAGGPAGLRGLLPGLVDARVELRVLPGALRVVPELERQQLDWAQVVLRWGEGVLPFAAASGPPVLGLRESSLAGMLRRAAAGIEALR